MTTKRICRAAAPPLALLLPLAALAQATAFDDLAEGPVPLLTPTHLRQAPRDVPASVTVLSGDQVRTYGILGTIESLRLLVGAGPSRLGWANHELRLDKKKTTSPPRVAVLVDGMQVQGPMANESDDGSALPVSVDDIDRIEVSRGPGVVGYGHATTAVIVNIVTRHAADVERGYARATFGAQGTVNITTRLGLGVGAAALRLTAHQRSRDGLEEGRQGRGEAPQRVGRFTVRGALPLGEASSLAVDAAHLSGEAESARDATPPVGGQRLRTGYAHLVWTQAFSAANELSLRLNHWYNGQRDEALDCDEPEGTGPPWRTGPGLSEQALADRRAGPAAACPAGVREERRSLVELQDVQFLGAGLRLVGGAGLRREWMRVEDGSLEGRWQADYRRLFAGIDWQAGSDFSASAGVSADDAGSRGHDHALRAGFNWHLSPAQTLRIAASTSRWASGAGRVMNAAPLPLLREQVKAVDLGYVAQWPASAATLEARAFWARLSGRAWSTKGQAGQEQPVHAEVSGLELRAASALGDCCTGFIGLSAKTEGASSGAGEHRGDWPWTLALGAVWSFGDGWRLAAGHYRTSEADSDRLNSARSDLTLLKDIVLPDARMRASLTWRQIERVQHGGKLDKQDQLFHLLYASIQATF